MTFAIRFATSEDRPALIRLKHQINQAEHASFEPPHPAIPVLDLSIEAATGGVSDYEAMLAETGGDWFVAEANGKVVGSALWVRFTGRSAFKPDARNWGLIMGVAVDISHRGHGIAGALMDRVEAAIAEAGCSHAFLEATAGNGPARGLYERRGYAVLEVAMLKPIHSLSGHDTP
jgi:ribosomal protein S18 acetylase RimI-like enzyme